MSRRVTVTIDMWIDEGREVREVTLDENVRIEAYQMIDRLRKYHKYNIVRGSVSWDSLRDDGRGPLSGPRKRFVFKNTRKARV